MPLGLCRWRRRWLVGLIACVLLSELSRTAPRSASIRIRTRANSFRPLALLGRFPHGRCQRCCEVCDSSLSRRLVLPVARASSCGARQTMFQTAPEDQLLTRRNAAKRPLRPLSVSSSSSRTRYVCCSTFAIPRTTFRHLLISATSWSLATGVSDARCLGAQAHGRSLADLPKIPSHQAIAMPRMLACRRHGTEHHGRYRFTIVGCTRLSTS